MRLEPPNPPLAVFTEGASRQFTQPIAQAMLDVDVPDALRCAARPCTNVLARVALRAWANAIESAADPPGRRKRAPASESPRPVPHPRNPHATRNPHPSED